MGKNKKVKKEDENLKSLEKEVSDLKNIAARAQADLVNYRNRMKIELLEIEKKTINCTDGVKDVLAVRPCVIQPLALKPTTTHF